MLLYTLPSPTTERPGGAQGGTFGGKDGERMTEKEKDEMIELKQEVLMQPMDIKAEDAGAHWNYSQDHLK